MNSFKLTVCKLGADCKRRGSEKSTFLAIFWGFLIFSGESLFSRNSTRKPLNLIKSPIFTNAPCKTTCLYNAPSMHTVDQSTGSTPCGRPAHSTPIHMDFGPFLKRTIQEIHVDRQGNSGKVAEEIAGKISPNREMLQILGFRAPGKANLLGTLGRHCWDLVPTFRAGCFSKSTVPQGTLSY